MRRISPNRSLKCIRTMRKSSALIDGGFARVVTAHGACVLKVSVSEGQRSGSLFAPIHWSDENSSSARVGDLGRARAPIRIPVNRKSKATPATIAPVALPLQGFVRTRRHLDLPAGTWWCRIATRTRSGGANCIRSPHHVLARIRASYAWAATRSCSNSSTGRAASIAPSRLSTANSTAACRSVPARRRCAGTISRRLSPRGRRGTQPQSTITVCSATALSADSSPTICACFGVGHDTVRNAVQSGAAKSVADIARLLQAGSNCGSCLPELKRILARQRAAAVA